MAARPKKQTALDGIETGPMSVPKMDRISVTFALMLDSFVMEWDGPTDGVTMNCTHCSAQVCDIEAGDDLRTLLNTALAHTC